MSLAIQHNIRIPWLVMVNVWRSCSKQAALRTRHCGPEEVLQEGLHCQQEPQLQPSTPTVFTQTAPTVLLTRPSMSRTMQSAFSCGTSGLANQSTNGRSVSREGHRVSSPSTMETLSMLLNRGRLLILDAAITVALLCVAAQGQSGTSRSMTCPDSVVISESAAPVSGWTSDVRQMRRKFERIAISNRDAGAREYQLAPDEQKQTGKSVTQIWKLKGYRSMRLFLSCFYSDTSVTLSSEIPLDIETCTFRFTVSDREKVVEHPEIRCR